MADEHTVFAGDIPQNYDRYLGPIFFEPHAGELCRRLDVRGADAAVLEIACGTGIVTRKLRDTLTSTARLVATDLNEPMLEFARRKFGADERVQCQQADAMSLPFADGEFDAVVCQFGLMFVPDRLQALREARRVLRTDGQLLLSVWDEIELNDFCWRAHKTIVRFFPADPPLFYEVPFSLHDREQMRQWLEEAGFREIEAEQMQFDSIATSAETAAQGLIFGNPVGGAIKERDPALLPRVVKALTCDIEREFGSPPRGKSSAILYKACSTA
jgi:ubiquinone/menaquinone biosynthesis C-methylase UbiE